MPSTRTLQPEREALATVGRGDVERGQLAHPLEPVADRVAMGEEAFGRASDVAVGVEEGFERAHQLGLVLLVVADEGRNGLVEEAAQLTRVLVAGSSSR